MMSTPEEQQEADRLGAVLRLNLLDTEPEERFDRITRMAKRMFQVPIALVSLIDSDRYWFKSQFGLDIRELKRDIPFCGDVIRNNDVSIVENTLADSRFTDNPLVLHEPKIRFYAGVPLHSAEGYVIGTLCLMDKIARIFHEEDICMLKDLGRILEKELAATHELTMDPLAGISNRRGFYLIAEHSLSLCIRYKSEATIAVFNLENSKQINIDYGYEAGDKRIQRFSHQIQDFFRDSDLVARLGGDRFAVLMLSTSEGYASEIVSRLRDSIDASLKDTVTPALDFSVGLAHFDAKRPKAIFQLIEEAQEDLIMAKEMS